jgi:hypothetical protein
VSSPRTVRSSPFTTKVIELMEMAGAIVPTPRAGGHAGAETTVPESDGAVAPVALTESAIDSTKARISIFILRF